MANLDDSAIESRHGKGQAWQFFDMRNFHPRTKAVLVAVGRCELCGGVLSENTLQCIDQHDEGIWIPDENALEQVELVLGEEKRRNKNQRRTERRREAMKELPGFYRASDLNALLQTQGGRCYYCGVKINGSGVRRDHLKSLNAAGSSNWPSNIVLACYSCNQDKSDRSAAIYWRHLQQERGAAWVAQQQARNTAVTLLAKQLTKQRKQELAHICSRITENFRLEIDKLISHQLLNAPPFEYPSVECDETGILICYLGVELRFPPNSHDRISKSGWVTREAPKLLNAILSILNGIGSVSLAAERWLEKPSNNGLQADAPQAARLKPTLGVIKTSHGDGQEQIDLPIQDSATWDLPVCLASHSSTGQLHVLGFARSYSRFDGMA